MQQRIDLDALEAAYKKATDKEMEREWPPWPLVRLADHLPALIAELRELRALTTPEPVSDRHKDGNWWLIWEPEYRKWKMCRWLRSYEEWETAAGNHLIGTPTHALPMPEEVRP